MATSGRVESGSSNSSRFYFQWQLVSQNQGGNFSTINWQWGLNINPNAYWYSNSVKSVSGYIDGVQVIGGNTWSNINGVGDHQLLSGTMNIGHNADGGRSFGISSTGWLYGAGNLGNSGGWDLPTIARNVDITSTGGSVTDETTNIYINYSNPGGFAVKAWIELIGITGNTHYAERNNYVSGSNFNITTAEWNAIRSAMASAGVTTFNYVTQNLGGSGNYSGTNYAYTVTVINANPVYSNFTYRDSNSTTSTITGDDQYLIQGYSTLELAIASSDKATSQKYATMSKYNALISSTSQDITYTTSNITQALGVLGINSNAPLVVKAIDSRGYFTSVSKTVSILPYVAPNVVATARRVNNFETSTNFHIEGSISRLTISGTDKNAVNTSTGVAYRYKKTTDVSWGSWTNKTSSTTSGNIAVTDFAVNLDRNYSWNVEVRITDKLATSTLALIVPIGTPIFRISTYDNLVYNNEQPLMPSHVGMVIMSTALTTAGAVQSLYGGTWVAWGTGRTPVGVDTGQTEFNTVEKTGGDKSLQTHTHASISLAGFDGNILVGGSGGSFAGLSYGNPSGGYRNSGSTTTGSAGSGSGQNLQPYITTYMWKRTV